jgi:hypothetical protein
MKICKRMRSFSYPSVTTKRIDRSSGRYRCRINSWYRFRGSCGKELSVSASESPGLGLGNKSMEELVKKKESVWTEW